MSTYYTILTSAGLAYESAANVGSYAIALSQIAVGDGNGNPTTPDPAQTSLVNEVYRASINSLAQSTDDPTQFIAELIIPATVGGFTIREAGVFTTNGTLFAVCNTPQIYKPTNAEGAFGDATIQIIFQLVNAQDVTISIDPNLAVATTAWVINYSTAANVIPGGTTGQVLAKNSNNNGDVVWVNPDFDVNVAVNSIEEDQTLAAGQTVVTLATLTTNGIAVYIEGVRLRDSDWMANTTTQLTLAQSYNDGTAITIVQNEEVGSADILLASNNLSDVSNPATALANLGGVPNTRTVSAASGLTGGGQLNSNVSLAVNFAPSGGGSATQVVSATDSRLSDARLAIRLQTAVTLSLGGVASGSISFDGSQNVTIPLSLNGTGVGAGSYGSGTTVPVINIGADGRVISASNTAINVPAALGYTPVNKQGDSMVGALTLPSLNTTGATIGTWSGTGTAGTSTLYGYSGDTLMQLSRNGASNYQVKFFGAVVATGGFQNSDRRLKKNIQPQQVERGFALKIARMFSQWDRIADGMHDIGLIAQRVKAIAARYVLREKKSGLLAIDKAGIALECSMDNAMAIEEYRKVIASLERRIAKLERRK
jgi:phage-related tail fiber protein